MKTWLRICFACTLLSFSGNSLWGQEPNFQRQVIDDAIQIGYGLSIGRVDADERPDIVLADKKEIAWYQNPGNPKAEWKKHVIARNLTERDNVCIAARDITGDGLVEIAVGANWNPGETKNTETSGACFYLKRPADPTQPWQPMPLAEHQPTTHRMHWLQYDGKYGLAVLPLHGVENNGGKGKTVTVNLYEMSSGTPQFADRVDTGMHMTHNFEHLTDPELGEADFMLVAGKEGYVASLINGESVPVVGENQKSKGAGEVRRFPISKRAFVGIEPMHGTDVVLYREVSEGDWTRELIDGGLSQGHGLASADLWGDDTPEVVAGWRGKDAEGKVGIKLYQSTKDGWKSKLLDDQVACEDLKVADLDGDGKHDIIAAGRATKNVVIYWNR